ncbi:FAD-dependent oxidoreductase [Streptomyces sp. NPDC049577]|uniref:FAD-dependent oxidoreductase n=1 Tax=Streptomyces sp. NPDC049577 TaxID=3155153 RepID=UPI00342A5002
MGWDVIVVGAGVAGLTSAVVLAERGLRVGVWTGEPPVETTSAVAGALWWPYRVEPREAAGEWALRSLTVLAGLARRPEETGVRMVDGTHAGLALDGLAPWALRVPGLRAAGPEEIPAGYGTGVRARLPLVDMPAHLRHLQHRLGAAGGTVTFRTLSSLAQATAAAPVVVNCTGLGARDLVPDPLVHPVQGQLVVVENPGVREWFVEADGADEGRAEILHVFPQPYGLVLGGTARPHVWDRTPSPATAQSIIARCSRVHPAVGEARVLAHRVGLRPARSVVRLEAEGSVVHNYGHGGAGVTVAWGCAERAAELVEALAPRRSG